jgi:phage tail sheath protein FI
MLRLCAAEAELFAVLALPEGYRTEQAVNHSNQLRAALQSEPAAGSYGAIYHPWLTGAEDDAASNIRTRPPDGATTGVIARRTLARGAWIAPANEALTGILALDPIIPSEDWLALQDAQVNVIRNDPRGFLCLSADTLALDVDLRPINVRRLVTVVRRAAARLGAGYVFEPNGPALWRSIQIGFEGLLGDLFRRGAFAGRMPDQGFRVSVRTGDVGTGDSGQLIIELGIAPALPMRFLTVVMVRADDGFRLTEG